MNITELRKKQQGKRRAIHLAAFLLPALGLGVTWAVIGIHPFGDWSVLAIDMRNQYVSFFAYLRDEMLLGGQSWSYTFSKALGGDMAGLSAYYLLSPFNLLLLPFPVAALADGIALVTIAKIGCCGLTMSLLLNRGEAKAATLLFSIPYALMDFNNAFQQNIMWLDGIILLPLIVLGIEKLLENRAPWLYIIALALAIITCYYIGYILCLFAVLYFCVSYFCFHGRSLGGLKKRDGWMPVGRFASASLIGGALSAAVLVPAILSLQGGKNTISLANLADESVTTLSDVLSRYLPGTINMGMIFYGYPQIYCGMLAVVCCVLYLLNGEVERRRRVGAGLLIGIILVSFIIPPVNIIWQGFNKPTGFLFRYSFLFSFSLLLAGWQGFLHLKKNNNALTRRLPYILAGAVLVIMLVWRDSYAYITTGKVLLGIGLLAAATVLLWLYIKRKVPARLAVLLLLGLVLADMGADVYMGLRRVEYFQYDFYADFVKRNEPVIEAVKEKDQSFYRMELTDTFNDNDALLFGYRSLTHFSSTDKMETRTFLDNMGLSESTHAVKYSGGSTVAVDNLLGLRYLLTRAHPHKPYQYQGEESGIQTWYNPQALPVGFMVGADAATGLEVEENLFNTHNKMWQALAPVVGERALYRPAATPQITTENLSVRDFYGEDHYEKLDAEADAAIELRITVERDDELVMLLTTENYKGAQFYLNGEHILSDYLTYNKHGMYNLGSYQPGDEVVVRLEPQGGELLLKNTWFYYEDRELLAEIVDDLKNAAFDPDQFSNAMLSGTVENYAENYEGEKTLLMLTIPYDEGWTASVDGVKVPIQKALDALMAIELEAGSYNIRLSYTPPGQVTGLVISGGALLAGALWWWLRRRKGLHLVGKTAGAAADEDIFADDLFIVDVRAPSPAQSEAAEMADAQRRSEADEAAYQAYVAERTYAAAPPKPQAAAPADITGAEGPPKNPAPAPDAAGKDKAEATPEDTED